jgi:two-component system KDP operon response regulator KdpE
MTISIPTKLLILDQDALGENFLNSILNPDGYDIYRVSSSTEGILTTRSWNPDVIIINIMQPSEDGWKLCRRIREYSQVPILVLAAVSDPLSVARWLDAGADDYLTKPFSSEMLVAHLQKLTRRARFGQTPLSMHLLH